jgi:hypothetical protein
MDVMDLVVRDAKIIAERRDTGLRVAQVALGDHRHLRLEVLERCRWSG